MHKGLNCKILVRHGRFLHDHITKTQTENRWEVFPPVSIPFGLMAVRVATILPVAFRGIIVMSLRKISLYQLIINTFVTCLFLNPVLSQTIWEGYEGVPNDSLITKFKETSCYQFLKKDFFSLSINKRFLNKLINSNESINIDSIKTVIVYDNSTTKDFLSESFTDQIEQTYLQYQYNVVERSNIEVLLAEQGMSQSGLISESSIIESGRFLGADGVIITKVLNTGNTINFQVKLVEIRSSLVVFNSNFVESKETQIAEVNWLGFYSRWLPLIITIRCILINRGLMW